MVCLICDFEIIDLKNARLIDDNYQAFVKFYSMQKFHEIQCRILFGLSVC